MVQLSRGELFRPTLTKIGILAGDSFPGLGAFHDHASLVFRKSQHDGQNQISRQHVLYKSHVQDVYLNTPVKKLSDGRNTVYGRLYEPIQLCDD